MNADRAGAADADKSLAKMDSCILIVVSKGMRDFLENTVLSIGKAGIDTGNIVLFTTRSFLKELAGCAWLPPRQVRLIEDLLGPSAALTHEAYAGFGTAGFGAFTQFKWLAVRFLLEQGAQHIVYTDVDIAWRMDPLLLLRQIATKFDLALQTEGRPQFPPEFCTGFMSFKNSRFCRDLMGFVNQAHSTMRQRDPSTHDQDAFNAVVRSNPDIMKFIYPLPEQLFMNGLNVDMVKIDPAAAAPAMSGKPNPLIFHANWTLGLDNKRKLLRMTGNWHVDAAKSASPSAAGKPRP